jgi:hypothetical protein
VDAGVDAAEGAGVLHHSVGGAGIIGLTVDINAKYVVSVGRAESTQQ